MTKTKSLCLSLVALLAGSLLPLAFSPFHFYLVAWLSPAALLYVWLNASSKQAILRGWLFGVGCFTVGASWVFISIRNFGNANDFLAGLITCLFVAILGLFPASQGYVFHRLARHRKLTSQCLLIFPALWVIWEWLRTWALSGFPWLYLGYSQIDTVLQGFASITGVYGISWLITLISACLLLLLLEKNCYIKVLYALVISSIFIVGTVLTGWQWTHTQGQPISVSLVQGNISQAIKWDRNHLANILDIYWQETQKNWSSKIIVWPEAALPTLPDNIAPFIRRVNQAARSHDSALVIGTITANPQQRQYFNSVITLGKAQGSYQKRHLVPFGEYTPLGFLFKPLMSYFEIPMSDLTPGRTQQPALVLNGIPTAMLICYEVAYPYTVLTSTRHQQLIISVSDDSWFGDSIASAQQLQMARMRALETGRYLLYSTNNGITAIINPMGKLQDTLPIHKQLTLTAMVTPMNGNTPLMVTGYYPLIGLLILSLLLGLLI